MMKITVITACYNSGATVADAIRSVAAQDYGGVEHLVIDGGSKDGTQDIVKTLGLKVARFTSEPDHGIYDALNKGIRAATGDVVGIMHSDDLYANASVLSHVAQFMAEKGVDSCYGDLVYVERAAPDKVVRTWRSGDYDRENFRRGWMPPHPAFFLKRSVYEKYGLYSLDFPLASDYELMLRMLYRHGVTTAYLPEVLVKMRCGGTSRAGVVNTSKMLMENYRSWTSNDLPVSPFTILMKPLSKLGQFRGWFGR